MTEAASTDQRDYWSGPSGRKWVEHQVAQDLFLSQLNDAILSRAGIGPGQSVIDIGCGTGALSVDAASIVGADGRVLASDISQPLLDLATQLLAPFPQAGTRLADAETADWDGASFDHAISRLGVMFFSDPARAFANIARALRPGGRMTFAAWAPAAVNPYFSVSQRIVAGHLGQPPRVPQDAPGPMGLADRDLAAKRLRAAGLADVRVEPVELALVSDRPPAGVVDLMLQIGAPARVVHHFEASEAQIAAIRVELLEWLTPYQTDDGGLSLPAIVNLIEARVP